MRNAARTPLAAHARSSSGFAAAGRAHEHEVGRAVGQVVDRRDRLDAEHLGAVEVRGEHAALGSPRRGCCAGSRSRTCPGGSTRPATSTPRGSNRAREAASVVTALTRVDHLDQGVDGDRPAVDDDQRVEVDRHARRGGPRRGGRQARAARRPSRPRSTAGSPRNGAEQRLGREVVDQLVGVDARRAARAGTRRRRAPRRARRRRRASRVGPNCGSRCSPAMSSRCPGTIGATSTLDLAVVGRGRGRAGRSAASATGVGVAQAEAHEAPLGLVGDRVAAQLGHDGVAERLAGGRGLAAVVDECAPARPARRTRRAAPWSRPRTGCGWSASGAAAGTSGSRALSARPFRAQRAARRSVARGRGGSASASGSSGSRPSRPSRNGTSQK